MRFASSSLLAGFIALALASVTAAAPPPDQQNKHQHPSHPAHPHPAPAPPSHPHPHPKDQHPHPPPHPAPQHAHPHPHPHPHPQPEPSPSSSATPTVSSSVSTTPTSTTSTPSSTPTVVTSGGLTYLAPGEQYADHNVFLGEVPQDEIASDPDSLKVVEQPQEWELLDNGQLVSPSGRALYMIGPGLSTFQGPYIPPGAVQYQCSRIANPDEVDMTIVQCSANGQSQFYLCSNDDIYADGSTCGDVGGTVVTNFEQFVLRHGIQK